jgi:hypothetical protein
MQKLLPGGSIIKCSQRSEIPYLEGKETKRNCTTRLHPEFGPNPTISTCFYCDESKKIVVLLGASYKEQAPMNMVLEFEPCDECQKKYADYTLLIEAKTEAHADSTSKCCGEDRPKFTGRWCALHRDCFLEKPSAPIAYVVPKTMNFILKKMANANN